MFLDTSGLLCVFDAKSAQHKNASDLFRQSRRKTTTNYVIAEFVALALARGFPHDRGMAFALALHNSSEIRMVYVDQHLHLQGFEPLRDRHDKNWSLCDAVSFVTMQQLQLTTALSTDHHFTQAGFDTLLK